MPRDPYGRSIALSGAAPRFGGSLGAMASPIHSVWEMASAIRNNALRVATAARWPTIHSLELCTCESGVTSELCVNDENHFFSLSQTRRFSWRDQSVVGDPT